MRIVILTLLLFNVVFSIGDQRTEIIRTENDSEFVITTYTSAVNLGRKADARDELDGTMGGYIDNYLWVSKTTIEVFSKDSLLKAKTTSLGIYKPFSKVYELYYPNGKLKEYSRNYRGEVNLLHVKFYDNEKIKEYTIHNDNTKSGVVKKFYENGFIKSEIFYYRGNLLVEKSYYESNDLFYTSIISESCDEYNKHSIGDDFSQYVQTSKQAYDKEKKHLLKLPFNYYPIGRGKLKEFKIYDDGVVFEENFTPWNSKKKSFGDYINENYLYWHDDLYRDHKSCLHLKHYNLLSAAVCQHENLRPSFAGYILRRHHPACKNQADLRD